MPFEDRVQDEKLNIGAQAQVLRDGKEKELEIEGRKIHSIPIMSGDFLIESELGIKDGVAGGNFFISGDSQHQPHGTGKQWILIEFSLKAQSQSSGWCVVASGSKVGSNKYKFLNASTNEKMCVTLKDEVEGSEIPENVSTQAPEIVTTV